MFELMQSVVMILQFMNKVFNDYYVLTFSMINFPNNPYLPLINNRNHVNDGQKTLQVLKDLMAMGY